MYIYLLVGTEQTEEVARYKSLRGTYGEYINNLPLDAKMNIDSRCYMSNFKYASFVLYVIDCIFAANQNG